MGVFSHMNLWGAFENISLTLKFHAIFSIVLFILRFFCETYINANIASKRKQWSVLWIRILRAIDIV